MIILVHTVLEYSSTVMKSGLSIYSTDTRMKIPVHKLNRKINFSYELIACTKFLARMIYKAGYMLRLNI